MSNQGEERRCREVRKNGMTQGGRSAVRTLAGGLHSEGEGAQMLASLLLCLSGSELDAMLGPPADVDVARILFWCVGVPLFDSPLEIVGQVGHNWVFLLSDGYESRQSARRVVI